MKRIFVVGGAGYIGSHTCKALAEAGMEPIVYDNLTRGQRDAVKWGPLVIGDVLDTNTICDALRKYQPFAVVHFAAFAYVGESMIFPSRYFRNNTFGTVNLLDAMRITGVSRIVFSSTCATYGNAEVCPISETSLQRPINPYGQSKLMVEQILRAYHHAYNLSFITLRYFNACGLDPAGDLGVWHDPETRLIPRALMAAAGQVPELEIFGTDYPTFDGTCIRDYVHVSDLANGHVNAVKTLDGPVIASELNLGTGTGISVREVLDGIKRVTNRSVPFKISPRRAGDPPVLIADPSRAREEIGFKPLLSDLNTIIETSWPFFRDRSGQFNSALF